MSGGNRNVGPNNDTAGLFILIAFIAFGFTFGWLFKGIERVAATKLEQRVEQMLVECELDLIRTVNCDIVAVPVEDK